MIGTSQNSESLKTLDNIATYIRELNKKYIIIYAHNGIGKTRLSMKCSRLGKKEDSEGQVISRDTLYFNAFTEDLFNWDNDLDSDFYRVLKLNKASRFFDGLDTLEMDNKIRPLLHRYFDFNFIIDYEEGTVTFMREIEEDGTLQNIDNIKISRGEENIFIWCFFLAIAQLAIDKHEDYDWVKYIYVDDPVSSLDDNNAIAIAHHLATILKQIKNEDNIKTIISTHHNLFFNVLCNELKNSKKYFLNKKENNFLLKDTKDTPFFYHITLIEIIDKAIKSNQLYTYHFSMLRTILEKAANFHGFNGFMDCIEVDDDDEERTLHTRMINVLNHGAYSLFEPVEMSSDNKKHFKSIFENFIKNYKFNTDLFDTDIVE